MSDTYNAVKGEYDTHLKDKGVKLPGENAGLGHALCILFENMGTPVSVEKIREYAKGKGFNGKGADSLQVRHLGSQNGFNIVKGDEIDPRTGVKIPSSHFLLLNMTSVFPGYKPNLRNAEFSSDDWEKSKLEYGNMCVNCGSKEGEAMRWEPYKTTVLEKGHMDPRSPLTLNNTIPQCSYCNHQYKNKAVFNNKGVVIEFNVNGIESPSHAAQ